MGPSTSGAPQLAETTVAACTSRGRMQGCREARMRKAIQAHSCFPELWLQSVSDWTELEGSAVFVLEVDWAGRSALTSGDDAFQHLGRGPGCRDIRNISSRLCLREDGRLCFWNLILGSCLRAPWRRPDSYNLRNQPQCLLAGLVVNRDISGAPCVGIQPKQTQSSTVSLHQKVLRGHLEAVSCLVASWPHQSPRSGPREKLRDTFTHHARMDEHVLVCCSFCLAALCHLVGTS